MSEITDAKLLITMESVIPANGVTYAALAAELLTARARIAEMEADRDRLEWLLKFIEYNGADGIANMPWTVVDPDELMEDRMELAFDRAAIDAARKGAA